MNFANPMFMICFFIPIFLSFFFLWAKKKYTSDLQIFAQEGLLPKITEQSGQTLRPQKWVLRVIGVIFLIFSLIGPQWGYQWQETKRQGLEIVFALDTSKSMLASDIKPSRLERSKLAIKDFLRKLKGDKVGLIAFSGTSFLQCPLTMDYNAFANALDAITTKTIPRGGTALGEAITVARKAFKAGASGTKILIIISDGENHIGDPVALVRDALKEGIKTYTIGIGSPEGELIVVQDEQGNSSYLKDEQGNIVKSTLNEQILKKIADAGEGAYFRSNSPSLGLEELYNTRLAKFTKNQLDSKMRKSYIERFQWPLLIAFILLLAEFVLGNFHNLWSKPKFFQKKITK